MSREHHNFFEICFFLCLCGFKIDEFWCEYFMPTNDLPEGEEHDESPDVMFHFEKVMK